MIIHSAIGKAKLSATRENVVKFIYAATQQSQLNRKMPIVYNN